MPCQIWHLFRKWPCNITSFFLCACKARASEENGSEIGMTPQKNAPNLGFWKLLLSLLFHSISNVLDACLFHNTISLYFENWNCQTKRKCSKLHAIPNERLRCVSKKMFRFLIINNHFLNFSCFVSEHRFQRQLYHHHRVAVEVWITWTNTHLIMTGKHSLFNLKRDDESGFFSKYWGRFFLTSQNMH